jgi:hypothetical protein
MLFTYYIYIISALDIHIDIYNIIYILYIYTYFCATNSLQDDCADGTPMAKGYRLLPQEASDKPVTTRLRADVKWLGQQSWF